MKLLILGASGMAGHLISAYMTSQCYDVTGFDRCKPMYCTHAIVGDARQTDQLVQIIQNGHFDAVINCIGILNQYAENDKALSSYLNAYFPHFLADITHNTSTQIVHMSTDCVFSGSRGGYTETDLCDGTSFYDRSKALGELDDDKNITLRNSIVGPDINPKGIGLLNWFLLSQGDIEGYTGSIWTGQTTLQLAKTMEAAIKQHASGLYNTVPDTSISKYDLLKLFNRYFFSNERNITPTSGKSADKSLIRTRFMFDYRIPDYELMVRELAEWISSHIDMYPHYHLKMAGKVL